MISGQAVGRTRTYYGFRRSGAWPDKIASANRRPRNYEIWYVYATGYNSPLNKIINETLARNGKLTEADLEQIYETYLSQIKTSDRIDKVGARVIGEIDDVMTLISDALVMSASYDASLDGASQKLSVAENRDRAKSKARSGTGK